MIMRTVAIHDGVDWRWQGTALASRPGTGRAGGPPFWRYLGLGRDGEQLQRLYGLFPRDHVLVLRYRRCRR
jgi:hypothetical protein